MNHPMNRVTHFIVLERYRIEVHFDDQTCQEIDFEPMLRGELYGPLADPCMFVQVRLDLEAHTLAWPNGADFDPSTLHDWPKHSQQLIALARTWPEPMDSKQAA